MSVAVDLVVIGGSLGGSRALSAVLAELPADFAIPIVVVLHRAKDSDRTLTALIQKASPLPVEEAEDKMPLVPGCVYLGPADYHTLIEKTSISLSIEEHVNQARPSIDVLFESAAMFHGKGVTAVILTCSSMDGAEGAAKVKAEGGQVMVQDPESAEAPFLSQTVIAAGHADRVLPAAAIGVFLRSLRPAAKTTP